APRPPGAAMDQERNRRVGAAGAIEVDRLDCARSVRDPLRLAQAGTHLRAFDRAALRKLLRIGGVFELVGGVVELLLVHVQPHARAFRTHGVSATLGSRPLADADIVHAYLLRTLPKITRRGLATTNICCAHGRMPAFAVAGLTMARLH